MNTINSTDQPSRKRIAIVGAGVSGLSAAYFLDDAANLDVTLYERLDRLGGNALTIDAQTPDGKTYPVDPVAYLFVKQRYPYFTQWLQQLEIPTLPITFENYFWNGYRKQGTLLTADLKKILSYLGRSWTYFRHLYLFRQVLKAIRKLDAQGLLQDQLTMREFMAQVPHVDAAFLQDVFYPLMSFAFHCDLEAMPDQPCGTSLRSYEKAARDPTAAYCIAGGIKKYIGAVHRALQRTNVLLNATVTAVRPINGEVPGWQVTQADGTTREYDQVLLALWPNQAAQVLGNGLKTNTAAPELMELKEKLSQVELAYCRATIHNDAAVMPPDKRHWATYSYRFLPNCPHVLGTIWSGQARNGQVFTTYDWSLEQAGVLDSPDLTQVAGPVYDVNFHFRTPPRPGLYEAQACVQANQGRKGLWFTGCFLRATGFHEDGLVTTLEVLKKLVPDYHLLPRMQHLLSQVEQH